MTKTTGASPPCLCRSSTTRPCTSCESILWSPDRGVPLGHRVAAPERRCGARARLAGPHAAPGAAHAAPDPADPSSRNPVRRLGAPPRCGRSRT
eukprot:14330873-Heterocapsa_arctica.AAC.1